MCTKGSIHWFEGVSEVRGFESLQDLDVYLALILVRTGVGASLGSSGPGAYSSMCLILRLCVEVNLYGRAYTYYNSFCHFGHAWH